MAELTCDFCGELVDDEPIRRGDRVCCSEACAFEATRSKDCAGRADSVMSTPTIEPIQEQGGQGGTGG